MLKEMQVIDQELSKNNLVRISDPFMKAQHSLFRAISMAVLYTHSQWQKVRSMMKLTLICNCDTSNSKNPFPLISSKTKFLQKFKQNKQLLSDYCQSPDSNCFLKENIQLTSVTFNAKVSLFSLSGDKIPYLQEISLYLGAKQAKSTKNHQNKLKIRNIMLVKYMNRYYCVMRQSKLKIINFVKQYVNGQIINNFQSVNNNPKEGVVHYPNFDENINRPHKKSLSDCGDLALFNDFKEEKNANINGLNKRFTTYDYETSQTQVNYHNHHHYNYNNPNHQMFNYGYQKQSYPVYQLDTHMNRFINPIDQTYLHRMSSENLRHTASFDYTRQNMNYHESSGLQNNGTYRGRLKFFDQNKNYGFIVVDELNQDLFVHLDDLSKAGISKDSLRNNVEMRFELTCLQYDGKHNKKSKKAVDLHLITDY